MNSRVFSLAPTRSPPVCGTNYVPVPGVMADKKKTFMDKVIDMLQSADSSIVSWDDPGTMFFVYDVNRYVRD